MPRLWVVRLGKFGEQEAHALETGELVTGWELPDLTPANTREAVLSILHQALPDEQPGTLRNWAAQLNQLKNVAVAGDLVVTPLKTTGRLAVGRLPCAVSGRVPRDGVWHYVRNSSDHMRGPVAHDGLQRCVRPQGPQPGLHTMPGLHPMLPRAGVIVG